MAGLIDCVRRCARQRLPVELCNLIHGTQLSTPILVLCEEGAQLPSEESADRVEIAIFIAFVGSIYCDRATLTSHPISSSAQRGPFSCACCQHT